MLFIISLGPLLHVEVDGTIIWDSTAFFQGTHIVHNHHTISYFMLCKLCPCATAFNKQNSKHSDSMCYVFLIKAYYKILIWLSSNML